ncbi:hypothetical protein [Mycobacterium sp. URHB0021]|jgi:hypothetical protein
MNIPDAADVKELLLLEGLQDFVALWEVHEGFAGTDPTHAPPLNQVQDLTLNLIRDLVNDGLFVLGVPDRKEPSGFELWDLPVDAAMARIEDAYVKNFDDRRGWSDIVWMNLTAIGQQLALELYKSSEP